MSALSIPTSSRADVERRFWPKVQKASGCWVWRGTTSINGRGRFKLEGKEVYAYRVSYALTHGGEIANGILVCHHCDNPLCVRPAHLFAGSHLDNMRDMAAKGRATQGNGIYGERHPAVRTSNEAMKLACEMYASGAFTQVELAEIFGVSQKTIGNWARGKGRSDADRPIFAAGKGHARGYTAPCGTRSAYVRHKRHGEKPCDPCREAMRTYERERRTRALTSKGELLAAQQLERLQQGAA